jgi:hypothetical protein
MKYSPDPSGHKSMHFECSLSVDIYLAKRKCELQKQLSTHSIIPVCSFWISIGFAVVSSAIILNTPFLNILSLFELLISEHDAQQIIFKTLVCDSQKTQRVSIAKINCLILFWETCMFTLRIIRKHIYIVTKSVITLRVLLKWKVDLLHNLLKLIIIQSTTFERAQASPKPSRIFLILCQCSGSDHHVPNISLLIYTGVTARWISEDLVIVLSTI